MRGFSGKGILPQIREKLRDLDPLLRVLVCAYTPRLQHGCRGPETHRL